MYTTKKLLQKLINSVSQFANNIFRFAKEVWNVNPENKTYEEIANEGLEKLKERMNKLGLAENITELGATPEMISGIADATFILNGGYKVLPKDVLIFYVKVFKFVTIRIKNRK